MSALAIPPSPRLRLVNSGAERAGAERAGVAGPAAPESAAPGPRGVGRAHLRLVTSGEPVAPTRSGREAGETAPRSARRPAAPRPRRAAEGRVSAVARTRLEDLEELAPNHPAVRARRRGSVAARGAAADRAAVPAAREPRREAGVPAPLVLRRLLAAGAGVLAAAAIVAAGIVVAGFDSAVQHTRTATVGQGQSLWDLAAATGASDVDEAMAQIVELNDPSTSTLQPGQTLLVPVQ
ncbi:MAG: LysM peptidoglycan-binding domain-containing protein [Actinomyces sp.]|uniref:LysM peptidoglycan-binding domain-containing protein n=1 Tax=Actinomyces sp. TaxID=29317 RepID=UPI0026DA8BB7|nr:LysM peptidoglycan-binding domain-containing protein [Actinomyces sp.]MDO4242681.1 LysM peptidoglycan-binding domain-containing protein [Actinomyces sp.]